MFRRECKKPAQREPDHPGLFEPLTIKEYKSAVSEEWFVSQASLSLKVLAPPLILEEDLTDTVALRGILVASALGLVPWLHKCPNVKNHTVKLAEEWDGDQKVRFRWRCAVRGHKCFRAALCPAGVLSNVHFSNWVAFIYFINAMRLNYRWTKIQTDIETLFGVTRTLPSWRNLYQDVLRRYWTKLAAWSLEMPLGMLLSLTKPISEASAAFPSLLLQQGQRQGQRCLPSSRNDCLLKPFIVVLLLLFGSLPLLFGSLPLLFGSLPPLFQNLLPSSRNLLLS